MPSWFSSRSTTSTNGLRTALIPRQYAQSAIAYAIRFHSTRRQSASRYPAPDALHAVLAPIQALEFLLGGRKAPCRRLLQELESHTPVPGQAAGKDVVCY